MKEKLTINDHFEIGTATKNFYRQLLKISRKVAKSSKQAGSARIIVRNFAVFCSRMEDLLLDTFDYFSLPEEIQK